MWHGFVTRAQSVKIRMRDYRRSTSPARVKNPCHVNALSSGKSPVHDFFLALLASWRPWRKRNAREKRRQSAPRHCCRASASRGDDVGGIGAAAGGEFV